MGNALTGVNLAEKCKRSWRASCWIAAHVCFHTSLSRGNGDQLMMNFCRKLILCLPLFKLYCMFAMLFSHFKYFFSSKQRSRIKIRYSAAMHFVRFVWKIKKKLHRRHFSQKQFPTQFTSHCWQRMQSIRALHTRAQIERFANRARNRFRLYYPLQCNQTFASNAKYYISNCIPQRITITPHVASI